MGIPTAPASVRDDPAFAWDGALRVQTGFAGINKEIAVLSRQFNAPAAYYDERVVLPGMGADVVSGSSVTPIAETNGVSWVYIVTIDCWNASHCVASAGGDQVTGAVLRSTDGARTWTLSQLCVGATGSRAVWHTESLVSASGGGGLAYSTDGGASWQCVPIVPTFTGTRTPRSPDTSVLRALDGSGRLQVVYGSRSCPTNNTLCLGSIYVGALNLQSGLFESWTQKTVSSPNSNAFQFRSVEPFPNTDSRWISEHYYSSTSRVWRRMTFDSGATWKEINVSDPRATHTSVAFRLTSPRLVGSHTTL